MAYTSYLVVAARARLCYLRRHGLRSTSGVMDRKTSMVDFVSAGGFGGNGNGNRISTPTFEATSDLQTFTASQ